MFVVSGRHRFSPFLKSPSDTSESLNCHVDLPVYILSRPVLCHRPVPSVLVSTPVRPVRSWKSER